MLIHPMTRIRSRLAVCSCLAGWLLAGVASAQMPSPPLPAREFRGAWIATVRGIDWPFEAGASTEKQQAELKAIVEKAQALKLNALIFQVRTMGDACYKSDLEPWSPWITGRMGQAPLPLWDPLDYVIKEAHARGIELHAWFNPFRALSGPKYAAAGNHVSLQHPEWCSKYGEDMWMDPGEPGVRDLAKAVILDVLKRYDVDGIHMDDYFYPYPIRVKGVAKEFEDDRSWKSYQLTGGNRSRAEWRRANVDGFVQEVYQGIKKEKPWVRFGISPFGLWRPGYPEGTGKGALDPYNDLSADSLKWLQEGWCDYLAPQLYWPIKPANLSFSSLFDWWLSQNTSHRHIWPGMASDKVMKDRQPFEILRQISVTRERGATMPPGHIHWNVSSLMKNKGTLADLCDKRAYTQLTLPPSASWLGDTKPPQPQVVMEKGKAAWNLPDQRMESYVKWWFVQTYEDKAWVSRKVLPLDMKTFPLTKEMKAIAVRAIGLTGMASDAAVAR
jgi:uncharacterized lipoprotein YddW (UPF0748 family)